MSAEAVAPHFRFRVIPVLAVLLLGFGLPYLAQELVDLARHYSRLMPGIADQLGWQSATHGMQIVLALMAVPIMKWLVPADYGLHPPPERSYAGFALLWGIVFGLLMAAALLAWEWFEDLPLKHAAMPDSATAAGWLAYNGLLLGPSDELLFRALLVSFLTGAMPGRVRLFGYALNGAGLTMAFIYAIYGAGFITQPFPVACANWVLDVVAGIFYAYWLERSKSVAAPALGHGVAAMMLYAAPLLIAAG